MKPSKRQKIGWIASAALAGSIALGGVALAQQGQTLTVLRQVDSFTYDPQRATAAATSEVAFLIGDTLVALDPDMKKIHPLLAKSWTVSPDGKTYTFELRNDVTFCSGKKMTSEDVVYTFKRMIDPENKKPSAQKMGKVKDIRAEGPTKIVYELTEPYNELLYTLSLMHATILNKDNVETLGKDFGLKGIDGTGPFCWESWTPRNDLVLKRHDAYKWGPPIYKNAGPAHVERIVWKVVPEDASRVAALASGQADLSYAIPLFAVDELKKSPLLNVTEVPNYYRTCTMGLKITRPLMSDINVRKAMNMAIDRAAMAKQIYFGHAIPAPAYLNPGTPDFNPATQNTPLGKYNPDEANKLLDAAGWKKGSDGIREKDGARLNPVLFTLAGPSNASVATALQGYLRAVGIELKVEPFDATAYFTKIATQEFDGYYLCNPYASAGDVLNVYWRSENRPIPNRMNWIDQETDDWLNTALQATDPKVRAENYYKVQQKVVDNALWVPIVHDTMWMVANKKIKDIKPHATFTSALYKGLDISISK
jgi:peptide/nickel transport system substrate-binding protein